MTFFKRIAVLILALFALFGFAACKDKIDPETKIKEALQSIALGDTNSITDSFDLISETGKTYVAYYLVNRKYRTRNRRVRFNR